MTKYIAEHSDVLGGIAAGDREIINEVLWDWRRLLGTIMNPDAAYLAIRGLKTLKLRVEKQSRSAQQIAEFLSEHPRVSEVYYPELPTHPTHTIAKKLLPHNMYGAVISFRLRGGREAVQKLFKKLKIITPSPSLGSTESSISCPALSSHSHLPKELRDKLRISDDLVRLSIGPEDVNNLIEDLDQALT